MGYGDWSTIVPHILLSVRKFQFVGLKNQDLWDINQKEKYILEDILNMVKMKTLVFLTVIMIALTGCGKVGQE